MKKSTILSVMATVAMLPAVVAQEPTPSVPEGVVMTTRAFINGKEVPPAEAEKLMQEMKQTLTVNDFFATSPAEIHKQMKERHERMVQALEARKAEVAAPELPPVPPADAPAPAPEPTPAPAPEAAPCCPNPDCTCGPAPKPCECKPGAVCGPKTAPAPAAEPAPAPEQPVPAPAPEPPAPAAEPAPVAPSVDLVKVEPGVVRLIVNGKEIKPVATRVVPATKLHPAKPACPSCGKTAPVSHPMPGDMPPCGKARPFDTPAYGTTPPCVRSYGKTMNPTVRMHGVRRTGADMPQVRRVQPAASPQAVRVIINGVETIVPVVSEGVNITIKPL